MITLFGLTVRYTGKSLVLDYQIPAEAHSLGVAAREWKRTLRIPSEDIENDGAGLVEDEMELAVGRLVQELRGAWEQDGLFTL